MGWIRMSCDWDWAAADESYKRALALEPGRGQMEAAQLDVALGRFETAVTLARRAVELDPIGVQAFATLGLAYWYGGQAEEAISTYLRILEISPENEAARGVLGWVLIAQSRPEQALSELDQIADPFWRLPGLAMVYHSLGRKAESDESLEDFIVKYQAGGAYNVAQVYAFRGEADRAFEWLDRAYDQHDGGMFLVKVDPLLKSLRVDARFKALLAKLRLPASAP
jgi:tetratricopeptide (TPR) repeat protein